MRIRTTILTIILSLLFASVLPAAQRGIKVTAKTPSGKAIPLYSGSYALVVGNGDYTNGWDPLPGAIRDVKDIARALKENGFQVILKTNLKRNEFSRAFGSFFYKYGRNKTNRLFFYYAGHGYTQRMYTGEDQGYLVMVDAPAPEKDPVGFDIASIDMQVVVTQAKKVKARHVLFMFDSCFSGAILNLRERIVPEAISDSIGLPVRQFITAGRANEPVPDHSIFKQAFLDLLEGRDKEPIPDGYITGEELGLYLKNKVPEYNASQHPQYGKIKDIHLDKGDFVFALKIPSAPKTPAPVPSSDIRDYGKIIEEREANKKKWGVWQERLETDMAELEKYDKSSALNPEEKAQAWNGLLSSYSADNPYSLKDGEYLKKAEERKLYWKGYKESGKLFVDTTPTGARVRILNIRPVFHQGMELGPGSYHVEVSKQGYTTDRKWVNLKSGEEKRLEFRLELLQASIQPTATYTRPSSSNTNIIKRDGIYVAYANGIVKDTNTGLEWKVGPDKGTNWNQATSWVQSLNLDGGGWQMPTMDELAGLYRKGMGSNNLTSLLLNTTSEYLFVWSGETRGSSEARGFYFYNGNRDWYSRYNSDSGRAFAVRSRSVSKSQRFEVASVPKSSYSQPEPSNVINPTSVLFFDDFSNNNNRWVERNNDQASLNIHDGYYHFSNKIQKQYISLLDLKVREFYDFIIEAKFTKVSGVDNYGYGIVWGGKNTKNYYEFLISENGYYAYAKQENGDFVLIIPSKEDSSINKIANILAIKKKGNKLYFIINGVIVNTAKFEGFMGNIGGFVVENKQSLKIDYIKVTRVK